MVGKKIKVFAPASVSNVACGFDIMGFALNEPGDEITIEVIEEKKVIIDKITGDGGKIPMDYEQNTAGFAAYKMLEEMNLNYGVKLSIDKKMPLGSGLGSSAASAVGSVYGMKELFYPELDRNQVMKYALYGEEIASKAIHADNVAPSLLGGFILIRSYDPIDIISVPYPEDLYAVVIYSNIEIKTAEAREILPSNISLKSAIKQWGNTAALIAGLTTNNYEIISNALEDHVIEQHRKKLIPNYETLKKGALEAGALGSNISGSGPSIFALTKGNKKALDVKSAWIELSKELGIDSIIYLSDINKNGPRVINDIK